MKRDSKKGLPVLQGERTAILPAVAWPRGAGLASPLIYRHWGPGLAGDAAALSYDLHYQVLTSQTAVSGTGMMTARTRTLPVRSRVSVLGEENKGEKKRKGRTKRHGQDPRQTRETRFRGTGSGNGNGTRMEGLGREKRVETRRDGQAPGTRRRP